MSTTVLLSADQEDIREVARRYLESEYQIDRVRELAATETGFDEERWRQVSELGWPAIALPEAHGGMGYGTVERCLLLEEMGRVLLPAPFLSSAVLAADMIACAGGAAARAELLPAIADGSLRAALVAPGWLGDARDSELLVADETGPGAYAVSGHGGLALDAHVADALIVVARTADGAPGVFRVDAGADGLALEAVDAVDPTRRLADVRMRLAGATRLDVGSGAEAAIREALDRSTVALAAEMVGAAQRCVDLTLEYVRDRRQFDVPIGSFQAIKHRCADMAIEADAAREAVYFAADVIESGDLENLPVAASTAKLTAGEAFLQVAAGMIQLHGGIGYTEEHSAHLYYKRAVLAARMLGTATEHRDRLAKALHV